ncbi:hypothetical protein [Bradyrhizobium liaoningense]
MKNKTTQPRRPGTGAQKRPADETLQKLERGEVPGQDRAGFEARIRERYKEFTEPFGYPDPGEETPFDQRLQALRVRSDAIVERLPPLRGRQKEAVPSAIVRPLNQVANSYISLLVDVAGEQGVSSKVARQLAGIRSSLFFALAHRLPPTDADAAAQYQIYEKKMSVIGAAHYAFGIGTNDIEHTTVSEGRLKESIRTFDEVARRAAALAEDIRSLGPSERVKIAEVLRTEVELAFVGTASVSDRRATDFSHPVLPSSEVLSEKVRRKAPKQKWLNRDRSLKQTPVEFIRETYADRLGRGFTQADLKACDKSCYDALHQWLRRTDPLTGKQNRIPPNLDLPSVEDWNARRVRQLRTHPDSIDDEERQRLSYIIAGRTYRGNEIK